MFPLRRMLAVVLALGGIGFDLAHGGENWPSWRGYHNGISLEENVPTKWSPTEGIAWKTPIPGRGHSSPIVWENAVFLTSAREEEERRELLRLDLSTGKIVWTKTALVAPLEKLHKLNSRASSTPVTDGSSVYVSFLDRNQMFVAAFNMNGEKRWEQRPGVFASVHGYCSNPVLYKETVIINGDHDGDAYLVCLRQTDGKVVWKTPRENKTRSYCTPIIVPINGRDQLILNGSLCTAGYDAQTGKQIWTCDGPSQQMVATIVEGRDLLFSLGGFPERHLLAIRKGGVGDITKTHIQWRTHLAIPYVPSPLLYGDLLHVVSDEGIYTCFDPATGKSHAKERVSKHVSSSIVGACNRVYITDDTGTTIVLENSPSFRKIAENRVGEAVYSSPAISQGRIFLRGVDHLFCIEASRGSAKL